MKTVPVTINITRTNNGPKATVDPWEVEIDLGDDLEWRLVSDYKDASATIEKKNSHDDWPFTSEPPNDIKKDKPKKSGKTKPRPKKRTSYNVKCSVVDGTTPIDIPIDPDIIIIGGT